MNNHRAWGDQYGGMSVDEIDDYLHPTGHNAEQARQKMIDRQKQRQQLTPSKALRDEATPAADNDKYREG